MLSDKSIYLLADARIVVSPMMCDRKQIRFPRSKKRRIQKKWRKRPGNWVNIPWQHAIKSGDIYLVHPAILSQLHAALEAPCTEPR